jgi:hypothetical protein
MTSDEEPVKPVAFRKSSKHRLHTAAALLFALGSFAVWQLSDRQDRPVLRSEIGLTPWTNPCGAGWNLLLLSGGHRILYAGGERDERLLVISPTSEAQFDRHPNPILIQDWFEELKERARP